MIHCYSLTAAPISGPLPEGIEGAVVSQVACGRFHAVVSEHDRAPRPTREGALAHAAVVAAAATCVATVPVRFGSHHRDIAALRDALAEQADHLAEVMARVGDRRELVVRASGEAPSPRPRAGAPGPADGGAYLRERLAQEHQRRAVEDALREKLRRVSAPLEERAAAVLERYGPAGPERCLLVPVDGLEETLAVARRCLAGSPDVVLGGPWPPYSFVEDVA